LADRHPGYTASLVPRARREKYDGSAKRGPGRPRIAHEIQQWILGMAGDNPRWGYTRIQGALAKLGFNFGRNTIKRILAENGIDPAGRRPMSWKTFLNAHWGAIAATDFFTIEVITWRGLVRYFALFVIDLKTRHIEMAGIVASPDGAWMSQIARNLTDNEDGFLLHFRYLIHDRDPLFTKAFRGTLESSGVHPVRLPSRSPNLNAYAERFVRSIKSECLAQVIPIGERTFDGRYASTSSTTTPSATTKGSATGSSIRRSLPKAVRSNAARGSGGFFDSTAERLRARPSFGTIRDAPARAIPISVRHRRLRRFAAIESRRPMASRH
ncbi:MAG: hypothetical protein ACREA0_17160, partial [bacterium]